MPPSLLGGVSLFAKAKPTVNRLNTELACILKDNIRSKGPITFRDFMSAALFHETHGFYTRAPAIGSPVGPFDTNAKFTAFGFGVAQAITQAGKVMGSSLRVLELGGGTGQLGSCIESFLAIPHEYFILETSSGLRAQQAEKGLKTISTLNELSPAATVVFGNEVLDAFPVHRVMGLGNEEVCELFVELDEDGEFCEQPGDLSTPKLDRRLQEEHIHLGRGQIAELCLEIRPFLQELERVVNPGYFIFIDYGDKASNIYSYRHRNGTLRSYYHHQRIYDPFFAVGQQDMTADVDFTAVMSEAVALGLELAGWTSQGTWLTNLGIQKYVGTGNGSRSRQQEVDLLIGKASLGSTFDVLMFKTKGLPDGPGLNC
jgi:SAM-dependent MidA family methyltransferase